MMLTDGRVLELAGKHLTYRLAPAELLAFTRAVIAEHEASKRPPTAALLSGGGWPEPSLGAVPMAADPEAPLHVALFTAPQPWPKA